MEIGEVFRTNLKNSRLACRLTQEELAKRCNIHSTIISQFETGQRLPSLINVDRLRKGLCCTFDDLLLDGKAR